VANQQIQGIEIVVTKYYPEWVLVKFAQNLNTVNDVLLESSRPCRPV